MTPELYQNMRLQRELDARNRPLTDAELDDMLPKEGYAIMKPPESYQPIRTPSRRLMMTPTPMGAMPYQMPEEEAQKFDMPPTPAELPFAKPEDYEHFSKLLEDVDEESLSAAEQNERKIMKLLLKVDHYIKTCNIICFSSQTFFTLTLNTPNAKPNPSTRIQP